MFTDEQVGKALSKLGTYRVKRAQEVADAGQPDGIAGKHLLALGMRETMLTNILGGLKKVDGKWVPYDPNVPEEAALMDIGVFQISRRYHTGELATMPGVAAGTWGPVIAPYAHVGNLVPRFEDSLQFTMREIHEAQAYGEDFGVKAADLPRFAIAAHNAGPYGALRGYREGDMDKYTALGDYSAWVMATAKQVDRWLYAHPNWRYTRPA